MYIRKTNHLKSRWSLKGLKCSRPAILHENTINLYNTRLLKQTAHNHKTQRLHHSPQEAYGNRRTETPELDDKAFLLSRRRRPAVGIPAVWLLLPTQLIKAGPGSQQSLRSRVSEIAFHYLAFMLLVYSLWSVCVERLLHSSFSMSPALLRLTDFLKSQYASEMNLCQAQAAALSGV